MITWEANNVDVLRISNDDDDIPDDIVMSDEDDIDVEKIDLFRYQMESVLKIRYVCI